MEKFNFVVLAPNRWDDVWMNRQHIFSIIGKDHNVIYSNAPPFYWDLKLPRVKKSPLLGRTTERDNVFNLECAKIIPRVPKLKLYDKLVKNNFCRQIERHLDPELKTVLYIFNPLYSEYQDDINADFIVFHPYDDFTKLYSDDIAIAGNKRLAETANLVITTSALLEKNYKEMTKNVYFVPNGVDYNLFSKNYKKAKGVSHSQGFKVGYTGSINSKIDIKLLAEIFSQLPEIEFYVVGAEGRIDPFQKPHMEQLKSLPNITFLGNKDLSDVPTYMNAMDINIIPYRTDPESFANAGYPLKLHEYLAVGKPIICSPIDSAFEFEHVLQIRADAAGWITVIKSIQHNKQEYSNTAVEKRRSVAEQNTWNSRAEKVLELISDMVSRTVKR